VKLSAFFSILIGLSMSCNIAIAKEKKDIINVKGEQKMYTLPPLPYHYNELEPYIDARTVEIHYTKHHQTYVDNLNRAVEDYPEFQNMPLETLLTSLDKIPVVIRETVRNNGGGHFAHSLFWKIMGKACHAEPTGELAKAIDQDFGGVQAFKDAFTKECRAFFASGWVWLCVNKIGKLVIISTVGHDVPMGQSFEPIMVFDVWEHAYYLKYQNRRPEYIDNWWNVVNWDQVAKNFEAVKKTGK
jgi:superoxide dismutase, Fe-Mn family